MNSVSVIVPVFNNCKTLDELVERTIATLNTATNAFEILLIDDGSQDNSWNKIEALTQKHSSCRGIRLTRNFGQHPAIRAGLERSRGDIMILMDADLEDKPEELLKLINAFDSNRVIQVVYTISEFDDGYHGRLSSRIFRRYFNRVTKNNLPDGVGTLRAFTQSIRIELLKYPERSAIYGPLMVEMGFSSDYVKVSRSSIGRGKSSYTILKRLQLGISALVLYSRKFYYSLILTGLTLGLIAAGYLIAVILQYAFGYRELVAGQTLMLIVFLLGFCTLLVLLGLIFVYLSSIFREVLSRPYFHIESEIGDKQGIR
jgi:glycosyltransferase involved in cell wall biosynthesis